MGWSSPLIASGKNRDRIPEAIGVYQFCFRQPGVRGFVVGYVGRTTNLRKRFGQHISGSGCPRVAAYLEKKRRNPRLPNLYYRQIQISTIREAKALEASLLSKLNCKDVWNENLCRRN